jgi:hypothetical protein
MEPTARGFWTIVHGMGFGALYLLACSGAMVELWRHTSSQHGGANGAGRRHLSARLPDFDGSAGVVSFPVKDTVQS